VVQPEDRALVLGSTQPLAHVDQVRAEAAGTSVLRRRSGGGAVLVAPDGVVWVDVALPAGDDLAERDVGRAFWWLGEVWAATLDAVGLAGAEVWRGGLVRSAWSDRVCFAGLGSGEVTVGGAKVVGMAQRRSRAGVLFQCAVPVTWDPGALLDLLALDDEARARGAAELAGAACGVGADVAGRLVGEFLDRLP
jgi:lipoate-protein ligase A